MSARLPVSCDVIPRDFTEGAWCGGQLTSNDILDQRASSFVGCRWFNHFVSTISFCKKIDILSALSLDAEMIIIFFSLSLNNVHKTKPAVIQDLPTPRNAWICKRLGPVSYTHLTLPTNSGV